MNELQLRRVLHKKTKAKLIDLLCVGVDADLTCLKCGADLGHLLSAVDEL